MNEDVLNCAEHVREQDPDRFMATMTAPVEGRGPLFVLYAFNLEVARAPYVTQEEMIAEMRLQWWRDAITEIYAGKEPRRHQVVTPLREVILQNDLPQNLFEALIKARRWDIYKEPHKDAAGLLTYVQDTGGSLLELACRTLDPSADVKPKSIQTYGQAAGLAAFLKAVPALKASGRRPFGENDPDFVRQLAREMLENFESAARDLKSAPKTLFPALRTGWMTRATLRNVISQPEAVTTGHLEPSLASKKLSLLWTQMRGRF